MKDENVKAPITSTTDLTGKVAIVTGASRGIGRAVCVALAHEGAEVAAVDMMSVEETATAVRAFGRRALTLQCDIAQPDQIKDTVKRVYQHFGKIDILINNAGILGDSKKAFNEYLSEEWDRMLTINLRGPALFTQEVWPFMVNQGGGKIVCLGSVAGKYGGVKAAAHYCASKGGVHAFVKVAAKKGAQFGIYVNGIAPGPIDTPMVADEGYTAAGIPLGRLGQPEDIAMPVVFLASQASNFITGIILDVNGGLYIS